MNKFFWKFLLCLLPCALAGWVMTDATIKYYRGDSGGFKLGVDLVGGTILVYEIDLRKNQDAESKFDPVKDINVLAESLKRRIDPNDLYNITIRPAGGEGRIEIILPTGGTHRTKKSEEIWNSLLEKLQTDYIKDSSVKLKVGRGKTLELADQIQFIQSEALWQKKLFNTTEGWERLRANALKYWAKVDNDLIREKEVKEEKKSTEDGELTKKWKEIPQGDLGGLSKFLLTSLAKSDSATTDKVIKTWLKQQAWEEMMTRAREKWKYLEPYKSDMERIAPDNVNQLTTFVLTKGTVIGQAALSLMNPLVGSNLTRIFDDGPDADDVRTFVNDNYGLPPAVVLEKINEFMAKTGLGKDLSVEEVQRIKDLVSKVGSLEFRILANQHDDAKAIEDVKNMFKAPTSEFRKELKEAADGGLPPPGPYTGGEKVKKEPRKYDIVTARGTKSKVTYSWVELGPQERRALNLDNAARTDTQRSAAWTEAFRNRNRAEPLPESVGSTDRFLLQGALFYSRDCVDRNLPEEERRKKVVEYFILTRDPEFVPDSDTIRTPKIDGSYLVNAYGAPGSDLRPTVHFTFDNAGGNLFGNITRKNVSEGSGPEGSQRRRHLAIILDGMVMSAPTINSEIRTQGQISGNFTQKEVDSLVNILRAGRLPATLKPQPVSENTIAATLGEDTIAAGVQAILLAFAAVLIFMCYYYRFAGLVASVALTANLLLTVGFMVAVQATFTLSGLAGIVLMLGMAVDANVLIYERLREERERGASLIQAIRNGYDHALPTIIDTHLSSIFTAVVLYVVGNDNLKGFAVSLTVGLLISLFTSLYMTRVMFDFWQMKGWLTKLTMHRLFARPDLDFMSIRNVMFAITLVVSILGVALFIGRLPNDLNIDFVGGTAYGGKLTKGVTITELRKLVDEKHQAVVLADVKVEEVEGSDKRRFVLTYPKGDNVPRTVSFSNVPDGNTAKDREETVRKRAMSLPDPSVELLLGSTTDKDVLKEIEEGKSRNFTIRTTEKEAELVQACLDQLLRDDKGGPLMKKVYARVGKFENPEARIEFYEDETPGAKAAYGSPSFVKSLLTRELRKEFGKEDQATLPFLFEVTGEEESDNDGKYRIVKVAFGQELSNDDAAKVTKALNETRVEFAARPQPDRLENFDSALANETRFRAMWAVLASWAAIMLYLWFRFGNWTFGLAAVICLIHDLFFTLGAIAACYFIHGTWLGNLLRVDDFKLDLPSVAALLTLVGYSVNDTIVVFDRIREVRGKNPELTPKMINDSINQTLSRTVLASLTTWLVVFVLYLFGGPGVHLFAFVMVVGVIVGTYSSIYIASPLLLMFGEGKHEDAPPLQGAKVPVTQPEGAPA